MKMKLFGLALLLVSGFAVAEQNMLGSCVAQALFPRPFSRQC